MIQDVSVFAVIVYLKPWFTANDAAAAPRTDLETLKQLQTYHDVQVGQLASKKLQKHLWYLSEHLVSLCLFDSKVPRSTKQAIAIAMQREDEEEEDAPKRVQLNSAISLPLEHFASPKSRSILDHLGIDDSFLQEDPDTWESNQEFKSGKAKVMNIPIVNYVAGHRVVLIEQFNSNHTTDENQLQYLLGVVENHRKKYPAPAKAILATGLQ